MISMKWKEEVLMKRVYVTINVDTYMCSCSCTCQCMCTNCCTHFKGLSTF